MASKIYASPHHLCSDMKIVSDSYQRWALQIWLWCMSAVTLNAQELTWGDTLRGTLSSVRTCFDVTHYDLGMSINLPEKSIQGRCTITFKATTEFKLMQLDLFENIRVDSIRFEGRQPEYWREYNAIFIELPRIVKQGEHASIVLDYAGVPVEAVNPPWDGGFSWTFDRNEKPWVAVSCQGIGASLWWPCKDHQSDEPDSMDIHCKVPRGLVCVANGQERGVTKDPEGNETYHWHVSYPINNYNVSINVGDYIHLHDVYAQQDGDSLALDYYVMRGNEEKAAKHFQQVKPMLRCYEHFLGEYPFPADGYALVETPYLGMEHQSAIAYGNRYKAGYLGSDRSGQNLDFDYIIIHETGHEWWGNSVTAGDIADMWIHESFCTYSEAIYVECLYGYDTAMTYVNALKKSVVNRTAIMGPYGVNREGHYDMYVKGMLFLNTLRHIVNNDDLWWNIIKSMTDTVFHHRITDYEEVANYFQRQSQLDLKPVFEQYVKHPRIPILEYYTSKRRKGTLVHMRWVTDAKNFHMPVSIVNEGLRKRIEFGTEWTKVNLRGHFEFDQQTAYYSLKKIRPKRRWSIE